VALFLQAFDVVDDAAEQFGNGFGGIGDAVLGDFEDLGFGFIERGGNVVGFVVAQLGNLAGSSL
jgi:hypothetical protein